MLSRDWCNHGQQSCADSARRDQCLVMVWESVHSETEMKHLSKGLTCLRCGDEVETGDVLCCGFLQKTIAFDARGKTNKIIPVKDMCCLHTVLILEGTSEMMTQPICNRERCQRPDSTSQWLEEALLKPPCPTLGDDGADLSSPPPPPGKLPSSSNVSKFWLAGFFAHYHHARRRHHSYDGSKCVLGTWFTFHQRRHEN